MSTKRWFERWRKERKVELDKSGPAATRKLVDSVLNHFLCEDTDQSVDIMGSRRQLVDPSLRKIVIAKLATFTHVNFGKNSILTSRIKRCDPVTRKLTEVSSKDLGRTTMFYRRDGTLYDGS